MNPIVEMDGDEMTRILWQMIKDELICPYVELNTEYFDLGLKMRDETEDAITHQAATAIQRLQVGVKCATITPNAQRMEEYALKKKWKSPNGTIRGILDGTTFRTPIMVSCIQPTVKSWQAPITVARHSYGDIYQAVEMHTDEPGTAFLRFVGESGRTQELEIKKLDGPAILMGMHNKEQSIRNFARSCFNYAISNRQDLWFSAKDTISSTYDACFRDIFEEEYQANKAQFEQLGIHYTYTLIDDAVSRVMRSSGGFIWAQKNYDGDVMSDMISSAFGSLAMMTSVLVSPSGAFVYEAAHGTVTRHYYRYLEGESTSTNPVATIFAWSGALRKRGQLDNNAALCDFADKLEAATLHTIESGVMTGDLATICTGSAHKVDSLDFIRAIARQLS